jgi:hypothetical protein
MYTQDCRPGLLSAVPSGLLCFPDVYPGLPSWATFCRPFGTALFPRCIPRTAVLGYFLPSLRDSSFFRDPSRIGVAGYCARSSGISQRRRGPFIFRRIGDRWTRVPKRLAIIGHCPEGTIESSPARQCWVHVLPPGQVPQGRLKSPIIRREFMANDNVSENGQLVPGMVMAPSL